MLVYFLQYVYPRRNLHAEEWRKAQLLSLVTTSATLLNPAQSPTIPCEYLSLDTMERWIILGFLLCHQHLNQQVAMDLFKMVCQKIEHPKIQFGNERIAVRK